jgi:phage replication-related protein YjqB (UPF0714/DUF867 family)
MTPDQGTTYLSFDELHKAAKEGADFRIRLKKGSTGIAVMAPHGGNIEPGTSRIARAVAGEDHSFYAFEGLKRAGNLQLRIPSVRFDEPLGLALANASDTVLAIHGCRQEEAAIFIGGRDDVLGQEVEKALDRVGFKVRSNPRYPGLNPRNICNRSRRSAGIQLEIPAGLRRLISRDPGSARRFGSAQSYPAFIQGLRRALSDFRLRLASEWA